ncbi:MAG TPA: hypothetical protein VIC84_08350, partial [Blastocatellia bacterium]
PRPVSRKKIHDMFFRPTPVVLEGAGYWAFGGLQYGSTNAEYFSDTNSQSFNNLEEVLNL